MTAAQQIAELTKRLDDAAFLGAEVELRLRAAEKALLSEKSMSLAASSRDNHEIASLRQRVQALEFSCSETEKERDALLAECSRLRDAALATNTPDFVKDDVIEQLKREVACYKAEAEHLQDIEANRNALNARLAAAERVCEAADNHIHSGLSGQSPLYDKLVDALASYDAAKGTGTL